MAAIACDSSLENKKQVTGDWKNLKVNINSLNYYDVKTVFRAACPLIHRADGIEPEPVVEDDSEPMPD